MSMTPASRASLADVIVLISQANLSDRRKQELRSAVRTVARLLDGEPANIAADPAGLRRCLEMIAPKPTASRAGGGPIFARCYGRRSAWSAR